MLSDILFQKLRRAIDPIQNKNQTDGSNQHEMRSKQLNHPTEPEVTSTQAKSACHQRLFAGGLFLNRFYRRETPIPVLEFLAAILEQGRIVFKEQVEIVFTAGAIKFALVIRMVPANLWAVLIDTATAVRVQVQTGVVDQYEPTVRVFIDLSLCVRNLPQQHIEVFHGARRVDVVGEIGAAGRTFAKAAFILGRDLRLGGGPNRDNECHSERCGRENGWTAVYHKPRLGWARPMHAAAGQARFTETWHTITKKPRAGSRP